MNNKAPKTFTGTVTQLNSGAFQTISLVLLGLLPATILLLLSFIPLGIGIIYIFDNEFEFSFGLLMPSIAAVLGYVGLVASIFRFPVSDFLKIAFLCVGISVVLLIAYSGASDLVKPHNTGLRYWYGYFYFCPVLVAVYLIARNLKERESVT
tara:strand:- start:61 stop:516 length:456 start_codon:yes stop_codon:yes gene_type:complete